VAGYYGGVYSSIINRRVAQLGLVPKGSNLITSYPGTSLHLSLCLQPGKVEVPRSDLAMKHHQLLFHLDCVRYSLNIHRTPKVELCKTNSIACS
jgi:hypothetical protein